MKTPKQVWVSLDGESIIYPAAMDAMLSDVSSTHIFTRHTGGEMITVLWDGEDEEVFTFQKI